MRYRILGLLCLLWLGAGNTMAAPLKVCLVSGSFEYDSDKGLGLFQEYLNSHYEVECTLLRATGWTDIPGLEVLDTCDVALFFTRRLELKGEQLDRIKNYCNAGKPVVALRTASHGIQTWLAFDKEVLGGNYKGHFDEGPTIETFVMPSGTDHPILAGVETFRSRYSLYRTGPVAKDATVLMTGKHPQSGGRQPLAWTRLHNGGRVFYAALGGVGDFENAAFNRMVAQALFWTADRPAACEPLPPPAPRLRKDGVAHLAMRTQSPREDGGWTASAITKDWPVAETAVIVCDMWDKHWCDFASERVAAMAPVMNESLKALRAAGIQIIHAPSETLGFYQDWPQRRRMQAAPACTPPPSKKVREPKLPIDDSDGGCPGERDFYMAWTRQIPAIDIAPEDGISDNGQEIYNSLQQEGIKNIIIMGVHTNMCVLGRSFGIRQMTKWGMNCVLVRDLTDTMYNPAQPPKVSHDEGTELVVRHIEQYWCPSLSSTDLLAGLPK